MVITHPRVLRLGLQKVAAMTPSSFRQAYTIGQMISQPVNCIGVWSEGRGAAAVLVSLS
jgi:hypothetical protein